METFHYKTLQKLIEWVFMKHGVTLEHAMQISEGLIEADLRGIDSHGIARLPGYIRLLKQERLNCSPEIAVIERTATTALMDADKSIGILAGNIAMQVAMEKAKKYGTGWVAVRNSNHFGIGAYYVNQALDQDMIGIAMTNASPLVAPVFGRERMLGTNPIAVAIPSKKEIPFVADFSTSAIANGKLEIAQRENKTIPTGWLQDKQGADSNNPDELKKGGILLPLGSSQELSSHKGYCLSALVDIFSGVLSGANFGPWVPPFVSFLDPPKYPVGKGIGHFFGAIRIDAFQSKSIFLEKMDTWIQRFQQSEAISKDQSVLIPGEIEYYKTKERKKKGIPLHKEIVHTLKKMQKEYQIPTTLFP